jgi:hypothetical protein
MDTPPVTPPRPTAMIWTGRVISAIPALFLLLDGVMKLVKPDFVVKATTEMGYPESAIVGMGAALTASVLLYMIPQTAVLGAILLTGYLGGAVASHVRLSEGAFPICFPVVFGAVLWTGLLLRDSRVRALLPLRSPE